jgi:hypothetical protein
LESGAVPPPDDFRAAAASEELELVDSDNIDLKLDKSNASERGTPSKENEVIQPVKRKAKMILNSQQPNIDTDKTQQILQEAREKEEIAKNAIENEKTIRKLAEDLKKEAIQAHTIATQLLSTVPDATQEIQQQVIDNANTLAEKARQAEIDVALATQERLIAVNSAEVAIKKAGFAKDITEINKNLDNIKPRLKKKKLNRKKFKLVNKFKLKCPDGFYQEGAYCGRLVKLSDNNTDTNEDNLLVNNNEDIIEGFRNKQSNNKEIVLIIIGLLIILAFRNKEFVKKTFNITL